jgi:hypothetical protein
VDQSVCGCLKIFILKFEHTFLGVNKQNQWWQNFEMADEIENIKKGG